MGNAVKIAQFAGRLRYGRDQAFSLEMSVLLPVRFELKTHRTLGKLSESGLKEGSAVLRLGI